MFHDRAKIHVQAGRGGGRGGDVVVLTDAALRDLSAYQRVKILRAGRGGNGRGTKKHGADGETVEIRVPVGTQVLNGDGGLVADLTSPGARLVLARGGQGGRGNARFATPPRPTPRVARTG